MQEQEKIDLFTKSIQVYLNTNYELIKLESIERSSEILSGVISGLLISFAAILFIFFISLTAGYSISDHLGNNYAGFIIVAGFYFLVALILILIRKKVMVKYFRNKIIRKVFSKG